MLNAREESSRREARRAEDEQKPKAKLEMNQSLIAREHQEPREEQIEMSSSRRAAQEGTSRRQVEMDDRGYF
jgi:hypothetical protein